MIHFIISLKLSFTQTHIHKHIHVALAIVLLSSQKIKYVNLILFARYLEHDDILQSYLFQDELWFEKWLHPARPHCPFSVQCRFLGLQYVYRNIPRQSPLSQGISLLIKHRHWYEKCPQHENSHQSNVTPSVTWLNQENLIARLLTSVRHCVLSDPRETKWNVVVVVVPILLRNHCPRTL